MLALWKKVFLDFKTLSDFLLISLFSQLGWFLGSFSLLSPCTRWCPLSPVAWTATTVWLSPHQISLPDSRCIKPTVFVLVPSIPLPLLMQCAPKLTFSLLYLQPHSSTLLLSQDKWTHVLPMKGILSKQVNWTSPKYAKLGVLQAVRFQWTLWICCAWVLVCEHMEHS